MPRRPSRRVEQHLPRNSTLIRKDREGAPMKTNRQRTLVQEVPPADAIEAPLQTSSQKPSQVRLQAPIIDGLSDSILDSLTSGVLAVDLEGRTVFMNQALSRELGLDHENWKEKMATDLFRAVTAMGPG